jgi:hypothetical protein
VSALCLLQGVNATHRGMLAETIRDPRGKLETPCCAEPEPIDARNRSVVQYQICVNWLTASREKEKAPRFVPRYWGWFQSE